MKSNKEQDAASKQYYKKDIPPHTIFGRLEVLEKTDQKKHACYLYKCRCACQKQTEILVRSDMLRNGEVRSCGCIHDELLEKNRVTAYKNSFIYETSVPRIIHMDKMQKNNTSGTKGVYWHKKSSMWFAMIVFQKKNYYLGYYHDKEKAIEARKAAEKEIYGNFLEWYFGEHPEKKPKD